MLRRRVLFVLLALIAFSASARPNPSLPRDVAGALSRLSSSKAAERDAAERELVQALVAADAPLLVNAARAGSAEVRSRIASALMSSARHFAIAAELAASDDAFVAKTGADALAGQAAIWLGASDQDPMPLSGVLLAVSGAFSSQWRIDLTGLGLEETLDKIARVVDGGRLDRPGTPSPALVLDPRFDPRTAKPAAGAEEIVSPVVGTFWDLLLATVLTHGAVFDVYGWNEGRTWFVVRAGNAAGVRSAQTLLREWVLAVERPASAQAARAAARALASSGWPAALEWLDGRWRERKDPAAFDGLVLAAGRGAVAASLATVEGATLLLQRADQALERAGQDRGEAREWARALLMLGSVGSEAWTGGFSRASIGGKCLRCALVVNSRACPPALAAQIEARFLAGDTGSEERCAALRALASLGVARGKDIAVPALDAAFEWAISHGEGRAFPMALRSVGAAEPNSWRSTGGLRPDMQAELCADALARIGSEPGAEKIAGARLGAWLGQKNGEELVLALLERESLWLAKSQLRKGLLAARDSGANPAVVARLLVCTESATPEEVEAATEVFARKDWSAADWRTAGALIARPGGALDSWPRKESKPDEFYADFLARLESVRDQLLPPKRGADPATKPAPPADLQGMQAGWVQACSRAISLLRARQSEPGATEFLRRLRVLFIQAMPHPLRRELAADRFPPLSPAAVGDVAAREPWLGF